jgi:hypothetical protein
MLRHIVFSFIEKKRALRGSVLRAGQDPRSQTASDRLFSIHLTFRA